jgi:hypothetical protein
MNKKGCRQENEGTMLCTSLLTCMHNAYHSSLTHKIRLLSAYIGKVMKNEAVLKSTQSRNDIEQERLHIRWNLMTTI